MDYESEILTISLMNLGANMETVRIAEKIQKDGNDRIIIGLLKEILEVLKDDRKREGERSDYQGN